MMPFTRRDVYDDVDINKHYADACQPPDADDARCWWELRWVTAMIEQEMSSDDYFIYAMSATYAILLMAWYHDDDDATMPLFSRELRRRRATKER